MIESNSVSLCFDYKLPNWEIWNRQWTVLLKATGKPFMRWWYGMRLLFTDISTKRHGRLEEVAGFLLEDGKEFENSLSDFCIAFCDISSERCPQ